MNLPKPKLCPDCREKLNADADCCGACGWMGAGAKRRKVGFQADSAPRHNMRCTWHSGSLVCSHPCALFPDQTTSGFCIFHRNTPDGSKAAEIADRSRSMSPEDYLAAAKDLTYGPVDPATGMRADPPAVAELRKRLRIRAEGGNVGLFATKLLGKHENT
jgi:hypothetical protein